MATDYKDKSESSLRWRKAAKYWKATEGNAKRPLIQLRAMAQMRPDGVWYGD